MALLARFALAATVAGLASAATACYDPTLSDCKVTCTADTSCAGDQVCGSGGFCVGTGAPTCTGEQPDAGPAPTMVVLHVTVMGKGSVEVDANPLMLCGTAGDCTFAVKAHTAHMLVASPQVNRTFAMWSGACAGSASTCTLTPSMAVTVGAKFE